MKKFKVTKRKRRGLTGLRVWLIALLVVILPATVSVALAQTGGSYTLAWWTVDGGGGQSGNGAYIVVGTLGQPEAGLGMSGGQFALQGGFWPAGEVQVVPPVGDQHVYLPLVRK